MSDFLSDSAHIHDKVLQIFAEFVPERSERVNFFSDDLPAWERIETSFRADIPRPGDLAFHLTDIRADAAFLVALHLFPERFTSEEVVEGMWQFFAHVPYHLAHAQELANEAPKI